MPARAAYCLNGAESSRGLDTLNQDRRGQVPDQYAVLDEVVEPVPARDAGQFATLPVEHGLGAGRRDLDIPGHEVPVLNGRMELAPAELPGESCEQAISRRRRLQPSPVRGIGDGYGSLRVHPGTQHRGDGCFIARAW